MYMSHLIPTLSTFTLPLSPVRCCVFAEHKDYYFILQCKGSLICVHITLAMGYTLCCYALDLKRTSKACVLKTCTPAPGINGKW